MATTAKFDPYHKWFGIPPSQQPPTHYRLLGLELFEPDREVIDAAANQRIAYLQDIAAGPHGDVSQRLLNEVAAARRILLNPKTKKTYDEQMQRSVAAKPTPPEDSGPARRAFAFEDDLPEFEPEAKPTKQRALPRSAAPESRKTRTLPWVIGVAVALLIATAGIIFAVMSGDSKAKPDTQVVKAEPAPLVKPIQRPPVRAADPKNTTTPPKEQIAKDLPKELPPKELPLPNNPMPPAGNQRFAVSPPWKLDGQELIAPAQDSNALFLGDPSWTDYDFSCLARCDAVEGAVTLIVRSQNPCVSAYFAQFGIGSSESLLIEFANGNLNQMSKGESNLKPEIWYKLTVKVRGKKIECLVEGKRVIEATDDKHPTGLVGFRGGAGIRFKDFQVTDPSGKLLWPQNN